MTRTRTTETGQGMLIFLIAIVAILVCLYLVTSGIARAAGYADITALLDAMTHVFPTP